MVAPMVLTSTIQPMAVLPMNGTNSEMPMRKIIAFLGLWSALSLPNHLGRMPSSAME